MPKLALNRTEKQDIALKKILGGIQNAYGKTDKEMADILGCSEKTYKKRNREPATFTLVELRRLNSRGWLTAEEKASIF